MRLSRKIPGLVVTPELFAASIRTRMSRRSRGNWYLAVGFVLLAEVLLISDSGQTSLWAEQVSRWTSLVIK